LTPVLYTDYNNNMRTTQRKGDIAVSQAISTFTRMGYDVSLPFTESASYDLVVDIAGKLKKVQVRFSSDKEVPLRRIHSNANGYVVKKTKPGAYDWLYILRNTGEEYLIKKCLINRSTFTPGVEYLLKKSEKFNGISY